MYGAIDTCYTSCRAAHVAHDASIDAPDLSRFPFIVVLVAARHWTLESSRWVRGQTPMWAQVCPRSRIGQTCALFHESRREQLRVTGISCAWCPPSGEWHAALFAREVRKMAAGLAALTTCRLSEGVCAAG
jgi:hypothetical protein